MAVYTSISSTQLAELLAAYEIGQLRELLPIQEGVENSNYLLSTTLGRFILTIYERRVDPRDLPFFLGLLQHLAERGLPCPLPVHGADGDILRQVAGKPASIVTFLGGRSVRRPTVAHCRMLGAALAALHLAGQGFRLTRTNGLGPAGWQDLAERCTARADEVANGLSREMNEELAHLLAHWPADLPAGVIHADLFPDNVFFADGRISGLIDFYFACNDLFAYDLGICINAWCFEADGAFNVTKARALVEGYRGVRPLSAAELDHLPLLARGSALRFMLTRLFDWLNQVEGALVKPKDPLEYLAKLRFHRYVKGPSAYGL